MKTEPSFIRAEFPRSNGWDKEWIMDNQMGPNAIWLMEWLCEKMDFKPGMRVLDLGCGRAMTSIFLAREFGLKVWAADLWISPDHNWKRIIEAGARDLVCPLKAEAHSLPFAEGFFDAVVSVDAYQYFGTDELYIDYLSRFVRPGGKLGAVVVGLANEFKNGIPAHLVEPQSNGKGFWEPECRCFKTAEFWNTLWSGTDMVENISTDELEEGWRHWRDFEILLESSGKNLFPSVAEALDKDRGENIVFVRLAADRSTAVSEDLYDPALGIRCGVDT